MVNTEILEHQKINSIVVTDGKRCSKFGLVLPLGKIGWVRVITGEILSSAFIIGSLVILIVEHRSRSVGRTGGRWKSRIGIAIDAAGNALSDNAAADVIAHLVLPSTTANQHGPLYAPVVVRRCVGIE